MQEEIFELIVALWFIPGEDKKTTLILHGHFIDNLH